MTENTRELLRIGITCYPTFGGSGVIATEIGMAMARRGHRVHFICYDVPRRLDRFVENIYFHEVEVRDHPLFIFPPYDLALASKMVEVATYEELDLFHVHYAVPHATSAYLAKQILGSRAPRVVTTLHGTDITLVGNDRSYLPITRFSIMASDSITVPSKFLRQATYDKLNIPSSTPIEVIPNFVDAERFTPPPETNPCLSELVSTCVKGEKTLIHISNFRPVKRVEDVVRIFAKVRERHRVNLVFIGDGPDRGAAEALVRDLGLESSVSFLGKLEAFTEVLQRSHVFLLPSRNESFGLAALEALSCGVPVVGSRIEGIPEVIRHGENGFLAEVGDIEKMAEYTEKLITDGELYQRMACAARRTAAEQFSQDAVVSQYEASYRATLRK